MSTKHKAMLRIVSDGTPRGTRIEVIGTGIMLPVTSFTISGDVHDAYLKAEINIIGPEIKVDMSGDIIETPRSGGLS